MDTIGDRLRTARKSAHERLDREYRITQSELACVMGLTQSSVNRLENNKLKRGEIDVVKLMDAASLLKASFLWLATGNGAMDQEDSKLLEDMECQKGFPVYWPQNLNSINKNAQFHMNVAPIIYERLTPNAFYTLVTDNGMSPHINMGDLVLVDPGGKFHVGSYVLARTSGQGTPVLRRIIESDEEEGYLLKPLNPEYKTRTLEKFAHLLGVAVEFRSFLLPEVSFKSEIETNKPINIVDFKQGG